MPRVIDADEGGGLRVPGIYAALLERETRKTNAGDPRLVYANPDRPEVGFMRRPTRLYEALVAGEPVEVPSLLIGGWTGRDERLRRLMRADRTIMAWRISPNDTVRPVTNRGRE